MAESTSSFARVTIPAGTPGEECPRCGVTLFFVNVAGAMMPFDVQGRGCYRPSSPKAVKQVDGEGIDHLPRCRGRIW